MNYVEYQFSIYNQPTVCLVNFALDYNKIHREHLLEKEAEQRAKAKNFFRSKRKDPNDGYLWDIAKAKSLTWKPGT